MMTIEERRERAADLLADAVIKLMTKQGKIQPRPEASEDDTQEQQREPSRLRSGAPR